MSDPIFTTSNGAPVEIPDVSQRIGKQLRATSLFQDIHLLELIQHVTKERVPERIVHARGSGAYGYFQVTDPWIRDVSSAAFLNTNEKTRLFFRGSTTGGQAGSAETVRDGRGMAFKLYTQEGNLDWAFLSTPVFGIRDGIKFPSLIHATKKNPRNNLPDANMFWDYFTNNPEGIHFLSMLFTDQQTPAGYQFMQIFSVNSYRFTKPDGSFVYVRIHMDPVLGKKNMTEEQATELAGREPEYHSRILFEAIEKAKRGECPYPEWDVSAQIITPEKALTLSVNVFDPTKTIPFGEVPKKKFGKIVLNENPDNFFAEVEQSAFSPTNVVPGWALSPDPILQTRSLAYPDTQRYRIGVNFSQLPVNKPIIQVFNPLMRDGFCTIENLGSTPNYFPSSFQEYGTPKQFPQPDQELWHGTIVQFEPPVVSDDFTQPRVFLERTLTPMELDNFVLNVARSLAAAPSERVRNRAIDELWKKTSQPVGHRIADAVARVLIERSRSAENGSHVASFNIAEKSPEQPFEALSRVLSIHNEGMFAHLPHVERNAIESTKNKTSSNNARVVNGKH